MVEIRRRCASQRNAARSGAGLDPLASKGVACTGHCPPVRVHALSKKRPEMQHAGGHSCGPPGTREYITVPGLRLVGPPQAGHGSVVRSVVHMRVAVILRRRLPNHKDVELTHLRLAASLPCPEGANHHIQPSGRLLVNVGCETQGVSFEKAWWGGWVRRLTPSFGSPTPEGRRVRE